MLVDDNWCLGCNRAIPESDRAYCSDACVALEVAQPQPAPATPPPQQQQRPDRDDAAADVDDEFEPVHYHRAKFHAVLQWRERVQPCAPADFASSPPSTSSLSASPITSRFSTLISLSLPAPACLAPSHDLPLSPLPERRLLPPATDMESLCPPTIALTGEDSLVITPPTQSVAAPAIHPSTTSPSPFKWLSDKLSTLRASPAPHDKDLDMPVGVDAASFHRFSKSQPVAVPSPPRMNSGYYAYAPPLGDDDSDDEHDPFARIQH